MAPEQLQGWAAVIGSLAVLIGAVWQGAKTRAEVRGMRQDTTSTVKHALGKVKEVSDQLHPNHGSSLRDALDRTERAAKDALEAASKAVDVAMDVREDQAQLRGDVNGLRAELRGDREATRQVRVELEHQRTGLTQLQGQFMAHVDRPPTAA